MKVNRSLRLLLYAVVGILCCLFFVGRLNQLLAEEEDFLTEVYRMEKKLYEDLKKQGLSKQEISDRMYELEQRLEKKFGHEKPDEDAVLTEMVRMQQELMGKIRKDPVQDAKGTALERLFKRKTGDDKESEQQRIAQEGILAEGDVIQIEVANKEEFNTITSIGTDGMIYLPLVGDIEARGLTLQELKYNITQRLSEFVRRPKVSVRAKKDITGEGDISFSYTVYLFGQVPRPGAYTVTGKTNVVQLISLAGGLSKPQGSGDVLSSSLGGATSAGVGRVTTGSDLSRVTVIREAGGVSWVNINHLLQTGQGGEEIALKPGDTVYISPASFENIDVLGEVTVPGSYALAQGQEVSLFDAIALAKGLSEDAAIHNIKVVNKTAKKGYRTTIVNLKKALVSKGEVPNIPNIGAGDAVYVSRTKLYHWKRFFSWISTTAGSATTLNSWYDLKLKLQSAKPIGNQSVSETITTYDENGRAIKSETRSSGETDADLSR